MNRKLTDFTSVLTYFPSETEYWMRKMDGLACFFPLGIDWILKSRLSIQLAVKSLQQADNWRGCSTQAGKLMSSENEGNSRGEVFFLDFD